MAKPTVMFFPSVAFYNKLQNIGLVEKDQLQRTFKKDKFKYQLFFKKSKHICPCLSLCVKFSVYFVSVNTCMCLYVGLVVLLNVTHRFVCEH